MSNKSFIPLALILSLAVLLVHPISSLSAPKKKIARTVVLVDDFDLPNSYRNLLGGWNGGDSEKPGICRVSYASNPKKVFGGTGGSMRLFFLNPEPGSFSYYFAGLNDTPAKVKRALQGAKYLSFRVKGKDGGENFKIELHQDRDGDGKFDCENDIVSSVYLDRYLGRAGVTREWRKAVIPLGDFKEITDMSALTEIVFTFEEKRGAKKGGVYLDDILFGCIDPGAKQRTASPPAGFKINGVPAKNNIVLRTNNLLAAAADSEWAESVWFEISEDNARTWKRIAAAYNPTAGIFKAKWNASDYGGEDGLSLRASAVTPAGDIVPLLPVISGCSVKPVSSDDFLADLEYRAFLYFYENQSEKSGLFRDTAGIGDASTAVTGFGLAALCVGAERGWISKEEAQRRALLAVKTFSHGRKIKKSQSARQEKGVPAAENKDGFFYHFLDYDTAHRAGKSEVSTMDTALLLCGMITAGEYFGGEIRELAREIYGRTDWLAFQDRDVVDGRILLLMGWTPEQGFINGRWDYFSDETILVTLLAAGSPGQDIPGRVYYDWMREAGSYGGGEPFIYSWYGSLFTYQYANLWFDFRELVDGDGVNWPANSKEAVIANRRFCIDHAGYFKSYGANRWGITSALGVKGYSMSFGSLPNGAGGAYNDGTISPLGAGASLNFAPFQTMSALQYMYQRIPGLRGRYGFKNSFNAGKGFYAPADFGLDIGAFLLAVENFRSGSVWRYFTRNECVKNALKKAGFERDDFFAGPQADIARISSVTKSFLNAEKPDGKTVAGAFDAMEELVNAGDTESFRFFTRFNNRVYEKALERLDSGDFDMRDSEKEFLRLLAFYRLYMFDRTDQQFNKFAEAVKKESKGLSDYCRSLNFYIKRFFSKKLTEEYLYALCKRYFQTAARLKSRDAVEGMREIAGRAFENRAYSEAARFYRAYVMKIKEMTAPREFAAVCGGIAERFRYVKRFKYSSPFDLLKVRSLITDNERGEALAGEIVELMNVYFGAGQFRTAKKLADELLSNYPGAEARGSALLIRGQCRRKAGDADSAIKDFDVILKSDADKELFDDALVQLGESYMAKDENGKAAECFDRVIEKYGRSDSAGIAHFNKGLICFYAGDFPEAAEIFKKIARNYDDLSGEAKVYLRKIKNK